MSLGGTGVAREAVTAWNNAGVGFVLQLGDLIDGQNSGTYGQGLAFKHKPRSQEAFDEVFGELSRCNAPMYHAIGNHELYNFDWGELRQRLNIGRSHKVSEGSDFYFSWSPHPRWRFIMLNPYCISLMQSPSSEGYQEAVRLMKEHNPNDVLSGQVNYFAGMTGPQMRYVPFNGGLGRTQLEWFKQELKAAVANGDRVVVMSHVPLDPDSCSHKTIVYEVSDHNDAVM